MINLWAKAQGFIPAHRHTYIEGVTWARNFYESQDDGCELPKMKNGYTREYNAMMYVVHSGLESQRSKLTIQSDTTVENFSSQGDNEKVVMTIFNWCLENMNYELSNNQICNGINLFLIALESNMAEKTTIDQSQTDYIKSKQGTIST